MTIKKEKLIIYIIGTVIGLVLILCSTKYSPNTFIGEEGLKQIISFLGLNLCGEVFICIFSVLTGYELISYLTGKNFENKIIKWIFLIFIIIILLAKCPSELFTNYNRYMGNKKFYNIYFLADLRMLHDCVRDLKEKEVNTLYEVGYDKEEYRSYSPKQLETFLCLYKNDNQKSFIKYTYIKYTCIKLEDYKKIEERFKEKNISEIKLYKNTNLICSMK